MDRNRAEEIFLGPATPLYKNPAAIETPPTGTFQTNPALPPTPLTPEHANLITEELRNLTLALGVTPATNIDDQIASVMGDGSWTPQLFHGGSPAIGITYTQQRGSWSRKGRKLRLEFEVQWSVMTVVTPLALTLRTLPFPVTPRSGGTPPAGFVQRYVGQLVVLNGVSASLDDLGFCQILSGEQFIRLYSRSGADLLSNGADTSGYLIGNIEHHV